ncbi:hypothetical protein [Massilia glaciei]|nr:hypothetical protein [Massilia glaciei]
MKLNVTIPALCLAAALLLPSLSHARIFNVAGKDQGCGPGSHFMRNATVGTGTDGKLLWITVCATDDRKLSKNPDAARKLTGQDVEKANKTAGKSKLPAASGTR